jgi:hypothetical protein
MNYKFYKIGFFVLLIIIIILMIFGPISNRSEDEPKPGESNRHDTIDSPIKKPEDRRRTILPPGD